MPTALSYPGVYVEEIPSGVRTITGVATSITAFIGRALRGPIDEPVTINSFGDFERTFGGLWADSALGFSVRDFFLNGGSRAIVVRIYRPDDGQPLDEPPATASLTVGDSLALAAISPGAWGNHLRARVEAVEQSVAKAIAPSLGTGIEPGYLFTLLIRDTKTGIEERFRNLTAVESARRVDRIVKSQSRLVRVRTKPANLATLQLTLPTPADIDWDDVAASAGVPDAEMATDGLELDNNAFTGSGMESGKKGLYALEKADLFNLLCIPPYKSADGIANQDVDPDLIPEAATYCERSRAFLIVDPPSIWKEKQKVIEMLADFEMRSKNAALYFPRIKAPNPLRGGQLETFAPSGAVAGIMARTDATRGVWKAPAGLEATINGAVAFSVDLTDAENGELNPLGVNCLRAKPGGGRVVWGARTLQGDDRLASEWKYIPVRRLTLYIEESLYRGTQWVVFEPNDEPLWSQIRLNVGAFMQNLFRQGAFQGKSPREAYFVKCDSETTTQYDIDLGVVNIQVGFAPLKPAEFVVIKIQQMAGQVEA